MKVFGIGCPKTGTKTLGEALSLLGLRGVSWEPQLLEEVLAGRTEAALEHARRYEAFDDLPWCLLYRELDQAFPGSKFILTVRKDSAAWLKSFRAHAVLGHGVLLGQDGRRVKYGIPRQPVLPEGVAGYEAHNAAVLSYFRDRPGNLLSVCWERGDGWSELCGFLGLPPPRLPFPHANKASTSRTARRKALLTARRILGLPPANPAPPYRVISPVKSWDHHTKSGGYHQLTKALGAVELPRRPRSAFPGLLLRRWDDRMAGSRTHLLDYQPGDWLNELKVLGLARWRRPAVVHVPYGEEQLDLLLRRRALLPCRLTASFHLPLHLVEPKLDRSSSLFRRLDGAVVLSTSVLDLFRHYLGYSKVAYIPHGVDAAVFRPAPSRPPGREARFIVVGSNGRDFETVRLVAERCAQERLAVGFDAVILPQAFPELQGLPNVRLHSGLAESELVSLYQRADALFLPLRYAVANNSILESLACGTPVIGTDLEGVRDYVDESCGWLFPPDDPDEAFELVRALSRERGSLAAKRDSAHRRAELFSWETVAALLREAHHRLLTTGEFAHYSGKPDWESRRDRVRAEVIERAERRKAEIARQRTRILAASALFREHLAPLRP